MGIVGVILILLLIVGSIQALLSNHSDRRPGLIIPGFNIILSTVLAMMASDYSVAFFLFFITLIPLLIWVIIYKLCRTNVDRKKKNNMNRMKIKDL